MTMMMMQRLIESQRTNTVQTLNNSPEPVIIIDNNNTKRKFPFDRKRALTPDEIAQQVDDSSRDMELSEDYPDDPHSVISEELNVEDDEDETEHDLFTPVDLTRTGRGQSKHFVEHLLPPKKVDDSGQECDSETDSKVMIITHRDRDSVCSDLSQMNGSLSPSSRPRSPLQEHQFRIGGGVVVNTNRRLAFSVENILDPNKFTGNKTISGGGSFNNSNDNSTSNLNCCWRPQLDVTTSSDRDRDGSESGKFLRILILISISPLL